MHECMLTHECVYTRVHMHTCMWGPHHSEHVEMRRAMQVRVLLPCWVEGFKLRLSGRQQDTAFFNGAPAPPPPGTRTESP